MSRTLSIACEQHGLRGVDAEGAIAAYRASGVLSADDRSRLIGLSVTDQQAALSERWGSDGARVAAIALQVNV